MAPQIIMSHAPSESELEEIELREFAEGAIKTTMQAALLGTLIAWTPSLFMLAYMARNIQPASSEEQS